MFLRKEFFMNFRKIDEFEYNYVLKTLEGENNAIIFISKILLIILGFITTIFGINVIKELFHIKEFSVDYLGEVVPPLFVVIFLGFFIFSIVKERNKALNINTYIKSTKNLTCIDGLLSDKEIKSRKTKNGRHYTYYFYVDINGVIHKYQVYHHIYNKKDIGDAVLLVNVNPKNTNLDIKEFKCF
jgi:hypothetical protein